MLVGDAQHVLHLLSEVGVREAMIFIDFPAAARLNCATLSPKSKLFPSFRNSLHYSV